MIFEPENLKVRLVQERDLLHREHEDDLEKYQKLLKDYSSLELRHEHLERQLNESNPKHHNRSPSDTSTFSSNASDELQNDASFYFSSYLLSNLPYFFSSGHWLWLHAIQHSSQ